MTGVNDEKTQVATPDVPNEATDQAASKAQTYAQRLIARAKELHESDAFAPAVRMMGNRVTAAEVKEDLRFDHLNTTRIVLLFIIALIAVVGFSLLLPFSSVGNDITTEVYTPAAVFDCYKYWFQTNIAPLFFPDAAHNSAQLWDEFCAIHTATMYDYVIRRAAATVVLLACGFLLAVSGLLFQASFRNPLATPVSLGVADGVSLGCIIFSMMGFSAIMDSPTLYYLLIYGLGILTVAVVLFLSKGITGGKTYNVFDMLLVGTVICQLLSGVNNYITTFVMDELTWENYYELQQGIDAIGQPLTWIILLIVFVLTLIPVFVLRFRLNLVSFDDTEGRLLGVRPAVLRGFALVLGSLMQLAAMATIGQVAMLSLAVPFLTRYLLPSDFRKQLLGNFLLGSLVLMLCVVVQHFCAFGAVTMPIGTVISIIIIPFFVWMMAMQKGGWE